METKQARAEAYLEWERAIVHFTKNVISPFAEIIYGIGARSIPLALCFGWGCFMASLLHRHLDLMLFKHFGLTILYPTHYWPKLIYELSLVLSGFWVWGVVQTILKHRMTRRLGEIFTVAGLKSQLGRLPAFVFDRPIDAFTRKLCVTRAGQPAAAFEKAKAVLESNLHVYIDEFRENRERGTIDILYAYDPMPDLVEMNEIKVHGAFRFAVGKTRARQILVSFRDVPHLLIAGQTGSGKSTFLRQLITTLYLKNKYCTFTLIDLKGGLEFQLFEHLDRINVVPDVEHAVNALQKFETKLKERMELLKKSNCKDIDAYAKKNDTNPLERHFLVIDEAAEMFLTGNHASASNIQTARRILSTIARQGRSVGVHLIIATQRPDARALDPQVKANLTGVLCFQMLNDASSITVLGNGRATELPAIPGRAIWRSGTEFVEVQTPYLSTQEVDKAFEKKRTAIDPVVDTSVKPKMTVAPVITDAVLSTARKEKL